MRRMPWPDYFMSITYLVRERSTCCAWWAPSPSGQVHPGYRLQQCRPPASPLSGDGLPARTDGHTFRAAPRDLPRLHAEQNVIIQAAVPHGEHRRAELYCTTFPCAMCSKMLINCGIKHIWYSEHYPDELGLAMLSEAGVTFEQIPFSPDMLKGPQHV